jgi:hypothetical protein
MRRYDRILRFAVVLAIIALGLIIWAMVDPRPVPVIVAMSVGQALGTLSLLGYVVVVIADLRAEASAKKKD